MKDFFSKVWVKVTAWILIILGAAALIIGGVTAEEISKGVVLVDGIIIAVGALVAFICSMVKPKK